MDSVAAAEVRQQHALAAAQGDAAAQNSLGIMHRRSQGGPVDFCRGEAAVGARGSVWFLLELVALYR